MANRKNHLSFPTIYNLQFTIYQSMIIGICGGTGSGKTTIAKKIVESVGAENVILIEQDSYYKNLADMPLDARHKANFDHPDAFDGDLLIENIRELKKGNSIEKPIYDYKSHTRSEKNELIEPKAVVIIEGILIFSEPRLLDLFDVKVYVDTPADVRFIRRLKRDIKERGRTTESVIEQYFATVRPMHFEFVESSKRRADLIIPEGGKSNVGVEILCGLVREKIGNAGQ